MPSKISDAEWEVMNVIWPKGPLTAVGIFGALPAGHGWKQKTVNTFLTRLAEKGVVTADKSERAHIYTARLSREKCVQREGESFLVEDLGSVNGTVINDIFRLEPRKPRALDSGDRIKLGETTLHFLIG